MSFKGKTVLITGASVGIGRATAREFAKRNADVVLLDMDMEGLEKLKQELSAYPVHVEIYACDVSDEQRVNEVCADAINRMGKIDILVNNAGIWRQFCLFEESNSADWRRKIDVNILGTLYPTRALINPMLERGWGRIINIASVAGVYGNAKMADYSMTKGAVIAFTTALAKEVTERGVLVNAVSPGSVSHGDSTEPSALSFMGRTGSHQENANLICFLASDEASYISGQNIQIDGCRKKM